MKFAFTQNTFSRQNQFNAGLCNFWPVTRIYMTWFILFVSSIILCQSFVKACFTSIMGNLSWISLLVCYQVELNKLHWGSCSLFDFKSIQTNTVTQVLFCNQRTVNQFLLLQVRSNVADRTTTWNGPWTMMCWMEQFHESTPIKYLSIKFVREIKKSSAGIPYQNIIIDCDCSCTVFPLWFDNGMQAHCWPNWMNPWLARNFRMNSRASPHAFCSLIICDNTA
jgi:hypothetical protein